MVAHYLQAGAEAGAQNATINRENVCLKLDIWCREQDLNLHAFWALDPKSSASANSAIPARCVKWFDAVI